MMTLDIAIATHKPDGIKRVAAMNLPHIDGVRYVVSWQSHENAPIPESLNRADVEIHRFDGVGQSHNRNNAFSHCRADIILFGDDDLIYSVEGLKGLIEAFESNPDVDLATFENISPVNPVYPNQACILSEPLPKGYWVAAYLIAYRKSKVGDLLCHPMLGLGNKILNGAEDEFFLLSAIRRGYKCMFFPITICEHPQLSTGVKTKLSPSNLRATGCYMAIAYPWTFLLRLPLKALRVAKQKQASFFKSLWYLINGAFYAPKVLRCEKCYRW